MTHRTPSADPEHLLCLGLRTLAILQAVWVYALAAPGTVQQLGTQSSGKRLITPPQTPLISPLNLDTPSPSTPITPAHLFLAERAAAETEYLRVEGRGGGDRVASEHHLVCVITLPVVDVDEGARHKLLPRGDVPAVLRQENP